MTISKAFKKIRGIFGNVTPRTAKRTIGTPTLKIAVTNPQPQLPTRDELHTRTAQILHRVIEQKLNNFMDALSNYRSFGNNYALAFDFALANLIGFGINDGDDQDAFCAALEHAGIDADAVDVEDVPRIAELAEKINSGDYTFLDEVYDDEAFGEWIYDKIESNGRYKLGFLSEYIDFERLAHDTREEEGGMYTSYGYFQIGELYY